MTGPLVATLFPESVRALESLAFIGTFLTCLHIKKNYRPSWRKADKLRGPESRLAASAVVGFPVLGLLAAVLISRHRGADPLEVAEAFSHCLFWGLYAGLIAGMFIQLASISRDHEGLWDPEMDGAIDGHFEVAGDEKPDTNTDVPNVESGPPGGPREKGGIS